MTHESKGTKVQVKCKRCKQPFMARVADRARGWGKFCSKSCKAIKQERRTGQYAGYLRGQNSVEGSNRWTDDDGNRCARRWLPDGRSLVSTTDRMTGHVGIEQFDRHGLSEGHHMSLEDLSYGGYNNAGPEDGFGDGKW